MKPLEGIRVLDLSHTLAGPFAAMSMSDLGAEVVKVESLGGDETRSWSPHVGNESVYFMSMNRGRKSIAVNLTTDEGREIVYRLSSKSDVILQNFRPGVAEKLRVDYDSIIRHNPKLVYCSIKGFGTKNNFSKLPAYDLIIQALSGLMGTTGESDERPPIRTSFALFDIITGLVASFNIVSCLLGNVKPAHIEVSLYEAAIYAMSYVPMISLMTGKAVEKLGSAHPSIVPYQAFGDKDGMYFVLAAANDGLWQATCKSLNQERLLDDSRFQTNVDRVKHRSELVSILEDIFRSNTRDHWIDLLRSASVPAAPVLTMEDLMKDDYLSKNGIISKTMHSTLGLIPQINPPVQINGAKVLPSFAPPTIGQHSNEILGDIGYTPEQVIKLKEKMVIR